MAWIAPEYSREKVNSASRKVLAWYVADPSDASWIEKYLAHEEALPIINNWRSAHSYPLTVFQMTLRRYAKKIDNSALIAQRIKRMSSIMTKLERFPHMKVSQMQDVGGCRAIVKSIGAVRRLDETYLKSQIKHVRASRDDYLKSPQNSGYRGIHLVYRFNSDKTRKEFNGLKIEIQLRSQYQHAWATAVETVGTFVRQALKSSVGEDDWLRFFALMGSAIALRERSPLVPGTPSNRRELISELAHYAEKLDVQNRLRVYGDALQALRGQQSGTKIENAYYYLLVLNPAESRLTISGYSMGRFAEAQRAYADAEQKIKSDPGTDAVLVSVDSLAALERAYPNYFADTRVFATLLEQALSGQPGKVAPTQLKLNFADDLFAKVVRR